MWISPFNLQGTDHLDWPHQTALTTLPTDDKPRTGWRRGWWRKGPGLRDSWLRSKSVTLCIHSTKKRKWEIIHLFSGETCGSLAEGYTWNWCFISVSWWSFMNIMNPNQFQYGQPPAMCVVQCPPFFCRIWRRQCLPIISGNVEKNCHSQVIKPPASMAYHDDGDAARWFPEVSPKPTQSIQSISPHFSRFGAWKRPPTCRTWLWGNPRKTCIIPSEIHRQVLPDRLGSPSA